MSLANLANAIGSRHSRSTSNERRIACIGISEDSRQALRRMLEVVESRTRRPWRLSEPELADVVFVGAQASDASALAHQRPQVLVTNGEHAASISRFTIAHPFRVMPLLELLHELDHHIEHQSDPATPSEGAGTHPQNTFLSSLRHLREHGSGQGWWVSKSGRNDEIWLKGDGAEYRARAETIKRIRAGTAQFLALHAAPNAPNDPALEHRPAFELAWYSALNQSEISIGLNFGERRLFKLKQWPDFGLLGGERWQLQAAALLSKAPVGIAQLQRFTQRDALSIKRFLCACDNSGLLDQQLASDTEEADRAAAPAVTRSGLMSSLFSALREKLGLDKHER